MLGNSQSGDHGLINKAAHSTSLQFMVLDYLKTSLSFSTYLSTSPYLVFEWACRSSSSFFPDGLRGRVYVCHVQSERDRAASKVWAPSMIT